MKLVTQLSTFVFLILLSLIPTLTKAQTCSGTTTLTATSGTFDDGSGTANYSNGLNCSWLIQPTNNPRRIELDITSMDLASFNDVLRIYDGTNNGGTLLATLRFNNTVNALVAFSGSMFIEFTTNNVNTAQGWDASYTSSIDYCQPNTVLTNNAGAFTDGSPFGQNYLDSTNCEWLIQTTTPNQVVRLTFSRFDTEAGTDILTVYDGNSINDPILGSFSGNTIPSAITSSTGDLLLAFSSDSANTGNGWRAIYQIVPTPTCSGNTTLTAASGTFDDGSGIGTNYTDNLNCSWLIQPPGASMINLNFTQFDTETGFDFVTIYDGANNSAPVLGSYSGNTIPLSINSSGGSLFIEFTSDQAVNETGWSATYNSSSTQCFSNLQLTSLNGSINDGSGANNYQNNLNCSWVIQPTLATSISASFNNFDLSIGDTLFLYDGSTAGAPLLAAYTGSNIPAAVTTTGGDLFIEFISNGSSTAQGWDLSYSSGTNLTCAGQTNLTAPSGSFSDGSGTADYDNNLNCSWLIQPTGNPASITLTLSNVDLSSFNDIIQVYDGANNGGTLLATIRFNNAGGNPLVAYSGSMFIEFTTNNVNTGQGWDASYSSSNILCQPNTVFINNNGGFTDGSRNGVNYLNNTDCEWLIQPTLANVAVRLNFGRFTAAPNDTLFIYDGANANAPLLAAYTANSNVNGLTSTSNSMFLNFKTDSSGTANGWFVTYNTQALPACSGLTNLTAPSGSFTDGSATNDDYVQNSNCQWLINPPGAVSVDLNFTYFSTQANFDLVRVYEGSDNSGVLLGTFSGTNLPPSLSSATGEMFVQFTTSNQNNSTGWGATYTSSNLTIVDAVPDTVYINAGAGSTSSFQLNSNTSWSTSDNQNWLISSPINGSLNGTINILAVQGNIGPERSALLFIDATNNTARDTVVVIQRSSGRFISSSPDTLFYNSTGSSQQAVLNTNVNWTLSSSSNWISFTPTSGNNNGTAMIATTNNTVNQIRQGIVVISGSLGATNDTIVVIQDSLDYALSVNPQNVTLNSMAGSQNSVQLEANLSWQASSSVPWLSISPGSGNDSTAINITASSSTPTTQDRSAFVVINSTNGRFSDTVFVTQLGVTPLLESNPDTLFFSSNTGDNQTLFINSSGQWETSANPSLFSLSQTGGNGNGSITVSTVTTNNNLTEIVEYLIIRDTTDNLVDSVVLVQAGIIGNIAVSRDTVFLAYNSGSSGTFNLSANIPWSANHSSSWLTVSPDNGNGNSNITVTANSENLTGNDRIAMVSLDGAGTFSDTVIVIQASISGSLSAATDYIELAYNSGSSDTFNLRADIAWSAVQTSSWLTVSPNTGNGNSNITVTANSANQTGSDRGAIILISGVGANADTVAVLQRDESFPRFAVSTDTIKIANRGASTGTFSILSNVSWSLNETTDWLAITPTSGSDDGTVTALAIDANLSGSSRFATITASSTGLSDQLIIVEQLGVTAVAQFSPDSLIIGADSTSFGTISITSNLNAWSVTENSNWLILNRSTGSFDGDVIATAIERNLTGFPRSTIVTLSAPPLVPQAIKVIQDTNMSIGINENLLQQSVALYPNPTKGMITVEIDEQYTSNLIQSKLFNMVGEEVTMELDFVSNSKASIRLEHLPNGIYFLHLRYKEETFTAKISLLK